QPEPVRMPIPTTSTCRPHLLAGSLSAPQKILQLADSSAARVWQVPSPETSFRKSLGGPLAPLASIAGGRYARWGAAKRSPQKNKPGAPQWRAPGHVPNLRSDAYFFFRAPERLAARNEIPARMAFCWTAAAVRPSFLATWLVGVPAFASCFRVR